MKIAMIMMSMLFAGSVFAQEPTPAPAPAGTDMGAPAAEHGKMDHEKHGKHKKGKKAKKSKM